jgi:Sec-independent protein translocase protein TatA
MTAKLKAIGSGIAMVIGALVFGPYELHATVQDLGR